MILTKKELELIRKLREEKSKHRDKLIEPSAEESKLMQIIRKNMTLADYLALPEEEQRKWYINCDPRLRPPVYWYTNDNGEEIYMTSFYFEPWTPEILNRVY
ncbi:MAG: hypothetical protein Q4C05_04620 [Akkermansia sp.]|nr:hypothetical protein [Akkermansia sp.]